jgi:chromosome segregation ATPase
MNRAPLIPTLLILATVVQLHGAQPDAQRPPSDTLTAERKVQITWEPTATPPDLKGVLSRLLGPEGAGAVAERVLNVKPEAGQQLVKRTGEVGVTDHAYTFSFTVNLGAAPGARPAAKEFADALVEHLDTLLQAQRREAAAERLKKVTDEYRDIQFEVEALRLRTREKHAALRNQSGRADLSAESLQAGIGKLEDERQRLELDLAGMEARLQAVQEEMEKASERAQKDAAADPVIAELERAEATRQKMLAITRKQFEAGQASQTAVSEAEAAMIDARVQLLDRRGAAAARGGDALAPLTRELQNLAIDIRDRQARLRHVRERLDRLGDLHQEYEELEWNRGEMEGLRRAGESGQIRLLEARRQLDTAPIDRVIMTYSRDRSAQERE